MDFLCSSFLKNLSPFIDSLSYFFLLFCGQGNDLFAFVRTTVVEFFSALFALYEKQMTAVILAIGVIIARFATLMADGNDIV